MRADRLVSVLLMLQIRGRVTAAEVARELEISERTARRDLDALGMAGLPVYSQQGRNGGWRLAGGGRTDLSGLSAAEVRALFLVSGPVSSATPQVRAALRKLLRALPESLRTDAEAALSAVVVDPAGWDRTAPPRRPPHLDAVQRAVVAGEQVRLGYTARDGRPSSRVVHPLGLACKGTTWYLVTGTDSGLRTFRVDRIAAVEPTGAAVERPADFDLAEAWRLIITEVDQRRTPVRARGWVEPGGVDVCRYLLGTRAALGPAGPDGRVAVELRGHSLHSLGGEIAGLGDLLEILEPEELRRHLAGLGRQLVDRYGGGSVADGSLKSGSAGDGSVWSGSLESGSVGEGPSGRVHPVDAVDRSTDALPDRRPRAGPA